MDDDELRAIRVGHSQLCLVCGFDYVDEPPWGPDGDSPSFDICACCGVEFGYTDSSIESIKQFRQQWIDSGWPWRMPKMTPPGWDSEKQLSNLPKSVL